MFSLLQVILSLFIPLHLVDGVLYSSLLVAQWEKSIVVSNLVPSSSLHGGYFALLYCRPSLLLTVECFHLHYVFYFVLMVCDHEEYRNLTWSLVCGLKRFNDVFIFFTLTLSLRNRLDADTVS